ncbi:MAG: MBL fold metallo-hydrolase [Chloroflexi bacterium]|nr:MAG: MBL fold metallo-hydrolase [Chloroflexota bacterium]MBL1196531.1 MBL fold metallo-hydrolase [Chloroflexota bacterium]NOH13827.1 MBL fold metallo-hydrolase [Chloroflexota bacterium]
MGKEFSVKFWGVRGSHPVSSANQLRYGGNTSSIEFRVNGHIILIDAGTGIINLGKNLISSSIQANQPLNVTLLLSHLHHDHLQGFPFFSPAFILANRISIFGPDIYSRPVKDVISSVMQPPKFPLRLSDLAAKIDIAELSAHQEILVNGKSAVQMADSNLSSHAIEQDEIRISAMHSYAHPGGSFFYRIDYGGKSIVYANDTEGYVGGDRRLIHFAEGADLLIHDAQYTQAHYLGLGKHVRSTQGFGHSTSEMACEVAREARVRQLALVHFDPGYDDDTVMQMSLSAREVFPQAFAAYEGLEIDLFNSEKILFEPQVFKFQDLASGD